MKPLKNPWAYDRRPGTRRPPWIRGLVAAIWALILASGCGHVINYPVTSPIEAPGIPPDRTPTPEALNELVQTNPQAAGKTLFGLMNGHPDPNLRRLGQALAKLPDFADGFTPQEAAALQAVYDRAVHGGSKERAVLDQMARENPAPYQYGGALQGFFWYVKKKGLKPSALVDVNPAVFLDYAWNEAPRNLKTPQDILDFMTSQFSYRINAHRAWDRRTFFSKKHGDCTEFTLLAGDWVTRLGRRVYVLLTRPTSLYGHASLIVEDEKGLWLMDVSRAALARKIADRKAKGPLCRVDARVWKEVEGFDRIFGPFPNVTDLVRFYEAKRGGPVPFRVLDYDQYLFHVEEHGQEAGEWWEF